MRPAADKVNEISRKKPIYPVNRQLVGYLKYYGRATHLPVRYSDLAHPSSAYPLLDRNDRDTLWEVNLYDQSALRDLNRGLTHIYALLKTDGDESLMEHLHIDRIDYCTFGNSFPFRVRVVNQLNDNYDYFYVKQADASRIYGLELEHILSPNRINYLVDGDTLIEEHIPGIPGDQFIKEYISRPRFNQVRIAKEFIKFNERVFVRLLGDMRAYNYVVDVTPDFEEEQYRIRAIDFDQQSYEGKRTLYLPQFFKENNPIGKLVLEYMIEETILQYQHEERTLIARRIKAARHMIKDLIDTMRADEISTPEKVARLRSELADYHESTKFARCRNMGDLVRQNLRVVLQKPRPRKA